MLERVIDELKEGDGIERAAAAQALGGRQELEAIDALVRRVRLEGYEPARREILGALKGQADLAMEPLLAELRHSIAEGYPRQDWAYTDILVSFLGELGDKRAIPLLSECLDQREERVIKLVETALMQIGGPEVDQVLTAFHSQAPADTRTRWVKDALALVAKKARSEFPDHRAEVDFIGIAPPKDLRRFDVEAAERLISDLEQSHTFEQVSFRAGVRFYREGEPFFAKRIDVENGNPLDFYWPPADDSARTPWIFSGGKVLEHPSFP